MRGVWIAAALVAVRMMNAMRGDPVDRSTFEGKRPADTQEILNRFWHFVTPMREQTVIAHAYAEASGHPSKNHTDHQTSPTPIKKRRDGAQVKNDHPYGRWPANFLPASRS